MKKSMWFLISGICLIVLAFVVDVIMSCFVKFSGTGAFDPGQFACLVGDVIAVIIGVLLILYSRKIAKKEE